MDWDSIYEAIAKWDLSPSANSQGKQRIIIGKAKEQESLEIRKSFNLTNTKDILREIDSHQVMHTLKQHGNKTKENARGQIAITLKDISQYIEIVDSPDFKVFQDNGRILYAKQINGHAVVIEEVLTKQNKLRFFDMWKLKGQINKQTLLSHSQRPNTTQSPKP